MLFDLYFEKKIRVENPRLKLFYRALLLVPCVLIFLKYYYNGDFWKVTKVEQGKRHGVQLRPEVDRDKVNLAENRLAATALCLEPGAFDYASGMSGQYEYKDQTCQETCEEGYSTSQCVDTRSLYEQLNTDTLLMKTHVKQSVLKADDSSVIDYFYPAVDGLSVSITYKFEATLSGDWINARRSIEGSSHKMWTVVKDKSGMTGKQFKPGEPIVLDTQEMLFYAGLEGMLDAQNTEVGEESVNILFPLSNPDLEYPIGRMTGLRLDLNVICDAEETLGTSGERIPASADGLYCRLTLAHNVQPWVYEEKTFVLDKEWTLIREVFHGIYLQGRTEVTIEAVNTEGLLLNLLVLIILFSFPNMVVRFVAVHCIGFMSTVFRRAIDYPFSVRKELGGAVARAMCASADFLELANPEDEGEDIGIERKMLIDRMLGALRHHSRLHGVDDQTVTEFAKGCFDLIAGTDVPSGQYDKIYPASFYSAFTNSEVIGVNELAKLADSSRKPRCLERFFMPAPDLYAHVHAEGDRPPTPLVRHDDTISSLEDRKKFIAQNSNMVAIIKNNQERNKAEVEERLLKLNFGLIQMGNMFERRMEATRLMHRAAKEKPQEAGDRNSSSLEGVQENNPATARSAGDAVQSEAEVAAGAGDASVACRAAMKASGRAALVAAASQVAIAALSQQVEDLRQELTEAREQQACGLSQRSKSQRGRNEAREANVA